MRSYKGIPGLKEARGYGRVIRLLVSFACLAVVWPTIAQSVPPQPDSLAQAATLCPNQLAGAIDPILNRPIFARARWGVLVQTLRGRQTLYRREAERYFLPASNTKLLTSAAALVHLGPQFRIRTSIYQVQSPSGGVVLQVVGRGDPTLTVTQLQALAAQLARRGIRRIDRLIADDRAFRGSPYPPTWEWEDMQVADGAPVTSLILNQNTIDLQLIPQVIGKPLKVEWKDPKEGAGLRIQNETVTVASDATEVLAVEWDRNRSTLVVQGQLRVGAAPETLGIAAPNPIPRFLNQFRQVLTAQGISVVQVGGMPGEGTLTEVAAIESPPLSELVQEINQWSNNLYTEVVLRVLGSTQPSSRSNWEGGLMVLRKTLTELGVNPTSYQLADGSGLSRQNLVSPEAIVQTLQAMAQRPEAAVYRASLPLAGKTGTLQSRFQNTPAMGQIRAKTGTLTGVSALSGYLENPQYQPLVFSILVNQSDRPTREIRQAIDEIGVVLTRLRSCN
ncbi:MAG: D-alanyl-D-alanine carboxypeptidase/D-alanyl-D-alanine-endopeptidase [Leptolyngbyaceae cyanobacterium bins.59]|nr:D-alanyl-D-alanine carboxypeptidase/D-alanyl-D-alanine-endopeptidase [Leptolyngbyaceae cyanobacterium bins.59]